MNTHLKQRIEELLNQYDAATLATCGPEGPQISRVPYQLHQFHLVLFLPHGSDHLFNLEDRPELVLLSPIWKLHGQIASEGDIAAPHEWQRVVYVEPSRLHILSKDGQRTIETIDF